MSRWAESYPTDYSAEVRRALFGLPHDWFLRGKGEWLRSWFSERGREPGDVLDIGCGTGLLHRYLPGHITGCDLSQSALDQAAERNPSVHYRRHDGAVLPFLDASFDTALAVTVMHHVPPAEWPSFLAEAKRILRPGGALIVNEHDPWNPMTRLSVKISPLDHDAVLLTARRTKRLMREAGLIGVGSDSLFYTAQYCAYGFTASP